ncbi:hypothetical protein A3844_18635 [Paenibacillus helianthi]|uniref:HEAT repeat domain-containing protein n=1 Tax=Paenibacillus helianthi TaxID=1349432 RepID=A0ABX3EK48_9BACL|nr:MULTISPECIES: hypothetical protein [Paenibacillus]OKP82504.1 hypothetical protein A3848_28175 [Paenibacillus sp. P32E]OKP84801.1 hypothetical protein A3844_18635 [Paenibacillus helianthi]
MKESPNLPATLQQQMNNRDQWPVLTHDMLQKSGLPGPRANLALAGSFASLCAKPDVTEDAWELITAWAQIPESEAAAGDPQEFLVFCAVWACGAHYAHGAAGRRSQAEGFLRAAMNDARWRIREAAAMGLQSIGEYDFVLLKQLLEGWRAGSTLLEQRAFVAALAHPPLLKPEPNVLYCLEVADGIMEGIGRETSRSADPEHFRVLSKGLEYSLSVFAARLPEPGFAMLRKYAESRDARLMKIVKSNLGKSRLTKKYPVEVAELLQVLTTG